MVTLLNLLVMRIPLVCPSGPPACPRLCSGYSSSALRWLAPTRSHYLRPGSTPDPDIRALARRVPQGYSRDEGWDRLGQKEMAFLLQFPVCDLDATLEAQDDVFGPIAEWLLDSILADKESRQAMADRFEQGYGRAEYCLTHPRLPDGCSPCIAKPLADGRGSHSDAHLVVWELMKMFWLVEQVRPHALDQWILDRDAPRPPSTQSEGVGTDKNNGGPLELTVAVFFGMFGAEETLLLTSRADSLDGPDGPWRRLITRPAVPETNGKGTPRDGMPPNIMSVAVFFNYIFNHSGRPNHIGWTDEPVAALEFKFFEYFLQRHLELCLDCQPFREDGFEFEYGSLQEFIVTIAIFSHDDVESRNSHCFWNWKARLEEADFLDGSERLTTYPPDFTRYYEERFR